VITNVPWITDSSSVQAQACVQLVIFLVFVTYNPVKVLAFWLSTPCTLICQSWSSFYSLSARFSLAEKKNILLWFFAFSGSNFVVQIADILWTVLGSCLGPLQATDSWIFWFSWVFGRWTPMFLHYSRRE